MKPKSVRLFVKPYCGWCEQAKEWLEERGIDYEEIDVVSDRAAFAEMRRLSDQTRAPVIDVDGEVLADFGAEELAEWWQQNQLEADGFPLAHPGFLRVQSGRVIAR